MDKTLRPYTVNLINSVIGVSILAMPFCFYKCGYFLGTLVLAFVGYITYLSSCQLLHLACYHKKRTYEFLAFHVFGSLGKLAVELCMIGMIMGTFVAFFVIIGDLGPEIAKDVFRIETSPRMRAVFLICLAVFVVVPLSMQKNIESLSNVSAVSLLFYSVFLMHIISLAFQRMVSGEAGPPMIQWNVGGIFQCMPIMSMAFGLQPQLFIVYEALSEPSIAVMQTVVKTTLSFVSAVYVGVGLCGYFAFSSHAVLPGDILTLYPNTLSINLLKIGFALTVAISFPLLIFPLRASIYSLVFLQKGTGHDLSEETTSLMPDHRFKGITIFVVFSTLICGIIVPNVEFVLALTGSVTGSVMFFILPALMYLKTFGARTSFLPPKATIPFSSSSASSSSSSSATSAHRRLRIHPLIVLITGVCVLLVGSMLAVEDQKTLVDDLKKSAGVNRPKPGSAMKSGSTATTTADHNMNEKIEDLKLRQELLKKMRSNSNANDAATGVERKDMPQPLRPAQSLSFNSSIQKLASLNSSREALYLSKNATSTSGVPTVNTTSKAVVSSSVSDRGGLVRNVSSGHPTRGLHSSLLKPLPDSANVSASSIIKRDAERVNVRPTDRPKASPSTRTSSPARIESPSPSTTQRGTPKLRAPT